MYDMALWMSDPFHLQVYANALHSVKTGNPAVEQTFGVSIFEWLPKHREESEVFNNAMTTEANRRGWKLEAWKLKCKLTRITRIAPS